MPAATAEAPIDMTSSALDTLPTYRAPMRSRDDAIPPGAAVARALRLGLCGLGGPVTPPPRAMVAALRSVDATWGERAARRLARFAAAPEGAFIWTREPDRTMRLGRLAGQWRYDDSPAARAADLVHVRDCDWLDAAILDQDVPAAVRIAFDRGGRNWQRIRAPEASPETAAVWLERADPLDEGARP